MVGHEFSDRATLELLGHDNCQLAHGDTFKYMSNSHALVAIKYQVDHCDIGGELVLHLLQLHKS